jgi:uncharacterized protein YndB with AHSA1/START domain
MSLVSASIVIPAPPQKVWDVVMDPNCLGEWVTIHCRLEHADDGGPRDGYEMDQRIRLRGVEFKVHWTLSKCQPAHRAVWEGKGPARSSAHTEYLLHEHDGGTRFEYRNEFRAPLGPLGAAASKALVGGIPEREAKRSLQCLKALF